MRRREPKIVSGAEEVAYLLHSDPVVVVLNSLPGHGDQRSGSNIAYLQMRASKPAIIRRFQRSKRSAERLFRVV